MSPTTWTPRDVATGLSTAAVFALEALDPLLTWVLPLDTGKWPTVIVAEISSQVASRVVVREHYLHRRPPISFAYGLFSDGDLAGVVTFGVPASRHLQQSLCPSDPAMVLELNRLWVDDRMPRNTESWFVSRALRLLPPRLVVSYSDPLWGHYGYVYRALNFKYAGWTDMDRKTPRYDYLPADPRTHTRDAFRNGYVSKRRRVAKVKYWIATGNHRERQRMEALSGWPQLNWRTLPPPVHSTEEGRLA